MKKTCRINLFFCDNNMCGLLYVESPEACVFVLEL